MNRLRPAAIAALSAALLVAIGGRCEAEVPFVELAKSLPNDANAVVVVNAAALYASPLGQREGWKEKYANRFEAAPLILPPSAERGVLAADLQLETMHTKWEAGAMELSIDPSAADIARKRGGRNDVLAGMEVTWLGKLCIVKFASHLFGVITPATRQEAGRWADEVKAGAAGRISPYLAQSISFADKAGTQLILAVDLSNTFTEARLRTLTAQSEALKGVSPDVAASILASIQGVKFGVVATDKLVGRVQLDFAKDAAVLAPVAKPLILKILAKAGAMLPEFATWTAESTPNSLALNGELSIDGMRRIFSLLALDAGAMESSEPDQATTTTTSADAAKDAMAKASLRYFRGVSKYVEDIDRLQQAQSLDQAVMWIENYARKVESLPAKNVDPDLAEYGKYVAQTFRAIVDEASMTEQKVQEAGSGPVVTNYRIGYLPTARTVNWGGDFERMYAPFGYADIDPQATQQRDAKSQQEIDAAVAKAKASLNQLLSDNETVRKKLTEKYGLKF